MSIDDQSIDYQVFEAVVMPLDYEVFKPAKTVAMGTREVTLRGHIVVVPVDRC